jgi:poly [ADP-ribose] polymerase
MATLVKEDKYIKTDPEANNNKFWYIRLFDDCSIETEYGRVGSKPAIRSKSFDNMEAAEKFYDKKCKSKEKGKSKHGVQTEIPYQKLKVMSDSIKIDGNGLDMETIVNEQIKSSSKETKELLRYFIKQNIHNITENTAITYNKQSGLFETPCGPVTKEGIDEARVILSQISKWMKHPKRDERRYGMLVSEYLMIIPSKVGRKLIADDVFGSKEDIEQQESILDSLEATYNTIIDTIENQKDSDETIEKPKLFDVELDLVTDSSVIAHIKKLYSDTKNTMHMCHRMKVKRVFAVRIGHMAERFVKSGEPIGNVKELWHGTRDGNILSIMKNGLIIPSSSEGHCTGRMFGDGLYFSDQSTKALNYAAGYWSGSRSKIKKCYMFLADVAMGKEYHPRSSDWQMHKKISRDGYDSTFAKAGGCVRNNEMIVYKLAQANLKYLVEFEEN